MEADRWVERVIAQRGHLPEMAELATIEDELRALVASLKEAQNTQAPVQKKYTELQSDADKLRKRAQDIQSKLDSSTANARELGALQTEIEHVRDLLSKAEDLEMDAFLELEPLDQVISDIKAAAQPKMDRRGVLQAQITELQATLDEEIASLRISRGERAKDVPEALLKTYEAAHLRVGISGAAQVENGRCDGCRIELSPLDFDRWKAQAEDTFMACPECGRLLLP
jgi:predicted  nucleic acid-binding Zn-ribbon protein